MPAEVTIVDTDIVIDAGRGVEAAIDCLKKIKATTSLCLSAISQMELIVGCRNKKEIRYLEQFLERFQILHVDESISLSAISLLKRYRTSHGLVIADAIIAATAITLGCPFISKNQKDFRFIKELRLLTYPNS